jgi:flagellar assembly factor FliW
MEIQTSRFGRLELEDNAVIQFPWGLPGFESNRRFVLMEHREGPFQWLQAVDAPDVAFVVCPPRVLGLRYTIPANKKSPIEIEKDEDLLVLIMVSFDRGSGKIKPHLTGPLLLNAETRKGYQWTLDARDLHRLVKASGK